MRRVVLEGSLGMRDAAGIAGTLAAALEANEGVTIDLSAVSSVDSAILQVLIAGHRSAVESGALFGFIDPKHPALRQALAAHGMVAGDGSSLTSEHDFWTRIVALPEEKTS